MRTSVRRAAPRASRLAFSLSLAAALWLTIARPSPAQSMPIEDLSTFPRTMLTIRTQHRLERFHVWIADTPARQQQGLMFVRDLPASQGMLFPQGSPQVAHFWMENTYIPLDMLFVGEDGRIAKIIAEARPFSRQVLSSDVPVIAVLEIGGGEAKQLGIEVGDRVQWRKAGA